MKRPYPCTYYVNPDNTVSVYARHVVMCSECGEIPQQLSVNKTWRTHLAARHPRAQPQAAAGEP